MGAGALAKIAFDRGESLNAMWFVIAALCCYIVAYRLYSAFVAARLLAASDGRLARLAEGGADAILVLGDLLQTAIGEVVAGALKRITSD